MMNDSVRSGVGGRASLRSLLRYHAVSRLQTAAASDVGRGSETLMTFVRGDLFRAARMFAARRSRALVVTGFFIPKAAVPAAESDGPVGAVELCAALRAIGGDAWLVSDSWCRPVVQASACGSLPEDHVLIAPGGSGFDSWFQKMRDFVRDNRVDTVIFIERVGPSRDGSPRNMRGIDILEWTAPLSRLSHLGLHTIGIGDGGNEIGMGRIAPYAIEGIVRHGERIACTVATQELIVSGTSNWGGHALVCALYAMGCRQTEPLLEESWHRDVLARIAGAGGLDGVTLRNTPTVDGLSEEAYFSRIRVLSRLAKL
ncbi:MAG: glutamate cyclase domain-containing protein [Bifidobacterium sp.]|jgi:hypothetical protein